MITSLETLHPLAVLAVAVAGYLVGFVWYSLLFGKAWMNENKFTPESFKGGSPLVMAYGFLLTLASTVALAALLNAHGSAGALKGAEFGLFVSVVLLGSRQAMNFMFERRTLRHFLIVSGHDVAVCTLQGAILGVWR